MPAPEGYCILVFEELSEQEEENTPGIPGGSLIFNPHDVENRIGELFFWPTVSLTRGELELHSPGQSPLPRDRTLRMEVKRSVDRRPQDQVLEHHHPLYLLCALRSSRLLLQMAWRPCDITTTLHLTSICQYIPPCGSWESKDALLAAACICASSRRKLQVGMRLQLDRLVEYIKKKTGRFEGFLVCTAGGKKREVNSQHFINNYMLDKIWCSQKTGRISD